MRKESEIDRALRLKEKADLRQKNIGDYFLNFSKYLREWLHRLSQDYKERKDFGIHPFILADYYQKPEDKEVALFASLLVSDNDNIRKQVDHLRRLISDAPYQWLSNREFVRLSMGSNQNKRIEGSAVYFWQLSSLFNQIYNVRQHFGDMETAVLQTMNIQNCNAFAALTYYLSGLEGIGSYWWKMNLLLLRLFRKDGLGLGMWGYGNEYLICPWNRDVTEFMQMWFPDFKRYGTPEGNCLKLFGFEDEVDFFYAYLGYKDLQKRKPEECSRLATTYANWYENGTIVKPYKWKSLLPEI